MKFKRYPKYKDSGVEWLGEIPDHWKLDRLRFLNTINPSKTEISSLPKDTNVSFMPMESIGDRGQLNFTEVRFLETVSNGYTYFRDGDLLVAKITPCFENGKGALAKNLENGIGFGTTELYILRPQSTIHPNFLYYLTVSAPFRKIGEREMKGAAGQKRVPEDFVRNFNLTFPTEEEQSAIADFLDRETARIDALIAKKERLIELLQEKRTALITNAVTKGLPDAAAAQAGLDPDVPMKDSGVEWLGEIPAHWRLRRLKFLLEEPLKYGANETAELSNPELPRYIRITDINEDGSLRDDTFRSLPENMSLPYLLKEGDLLFARSGATVGKSFRYLDVWGRAAHAGYLIRARLKTERAIPRFVEFFAQSKCYWNWLSSTFIQATIQNVSAEKYANLLIPTPSLEEQHLIVDFIESKCQAFERLLAIIHNAIKYLKEYRTALISAAVTGKIDVRDEV